MGGTGKEGTFAHSDRNVPHSAVLVVLASDFGPIQRAVPSDQARAHVRAALESDDYTLLGIFPDIKSDALSGVPFGPFLRD